MDRRIPVSSLDVVGCRFLVLMDAKAGREHLDLQGEMILARNRLKSHQHKDGTLSQRGKHPCTRIYTYDEGRR